MVERVQRLLAGLEKAAHLDLRPFCFLLRLDFEHALRTCSTANWVQRGRVCPMQEIASHKVIPLHVVGRKSGAQRPRAQLKGRQPSDAASAEVRDLLGVAPGFPAAVRAGILSTAPEKAQ